MSASLYRGQLGRKRKARTDAEKKAGALRVKESGKRSDAAKAREAAGKSKNAATIKSKQMAAARYETAANTAAREASTLESKAARYGSEMAALEVKLATAERTEREAADKTRQREQRQTERRATAEQMRIENRLSTAEEQVSTVLKELRAPKPEKLRVLMLGAASAGDLRVGREQERIRAAVERATHRDLVELDVHPAATADILLDGLTRFRPHVVHFSGHSTEDLIVFEKDIDHRHSRRLRKRSCGRRRAAAAGPAQLLPLCRTNQEPDRQRSFCHRHVGHDRRS